MFGGKLAGFWRAGIRGAKTSRTVFDEDLQKEAAQLRLARLAGLKDVTRQERHVDTNAYKLDPQRIENLLKKVLPADRLEEGLHDYRRRLCAKLETSHKVSDEKLSAKKNADDYSSHIVLGNPKSLKGNAKHAQMQSTIKGRRGAVKKPASRCKLNSNVGRHYELSEGLIKARKLVQEKNWPEAEKLYLLLADENLQSTVLLELAKSAYDSGQMDVAGRAAIRAHNINSKCFNTNVFLAEFLLEFAKSRDSPSRYYQIALSHADKALAVNYDSRVTLLKCRILTEMGKYKRAHVLLAPIIKKAEIRNINLIEYSAFYVEFARALAGLGKRSACERALKKAIECHSEHHEAHFLLAQFYHTVKRNHVEAAIHLKRALKIKPDDANTLIALGRLNLDTENPSRDYAMARKCLEKAISLAHQSHPELFFDVGLAALQLSDYRAALEYFQKAHQLDPDAQRRWLSLAMMAESLTLDENSAESHFAQAAQLYQLALDERHDDTIKLNLLKCLLRSNQQPSVAENLAKQLLVEQSNNPQVHTLMADLLFSTHQSSLDALHHCKSALKLNPSDGHALLVKGKIHLSILEYSEALDCLNRSLECERENLAQLTTDCQPQIHDISFAFEACFMLGKCHSALNDHSKAYECYAKALSLDPKNVFVMLHLAETCQATNRDDEALELLRTACVLDPSSLRSHFHLANHLAQLKLYQQAIYHYEKVIHHMNVKFDPSDPHSSAAELDALDLDELAFKVYNNLSNSYHQLSLTSKNLKFTKLSRQYLSLASGIAEKIRKNNPNSPLLMDYDI